MRTRSSRRATKVALAGLVSFSLVAAACGSDDDDGDTQSTDAPSGTEAPSDTEAPDEPEPEAEEPEPVTTEDVTEGEVITEDVVVEDEEPTDPVAGGTVRYGLEAEVDGINPTTSALSSPGLMMGNAVFDTLTA